MCLSETVPAKQVVRGVGRQFSRLLASAINARLLTPPCQRAALSVRGVGPGVGGVEDRRLDGAGRGALPRLVHPLCSGDGCTEVSVASVGVVMTEAR